MMPQPVHRRLSLLMIARADLKVKLLFDNEIFFACLLADICTGWEAELGPWSVAGLIKWNEVHLQMKASTRHSLTEMWRDVDLLLWCHCRCPPCLPVSNAGWRPAAGALGDAQL